MSTHELREAFRQWHSVLESDGWAVAQEFIEHCEPELQDELRRLAAEFAELQQRLRVTWTGKSIGPYAIEEEIGRGAAGVVWRGRHSETGREVAIKLLLPRATLDRSAFARFQREARVVRQIEHPEIAARVQAPDAARVGEQQRALPVAGQVEGLHRERLAGPGGDQGRARRDHAALAGHRVDGRDAVRVGHRVLAALEPLAAAGAAPEQGAVPGDPLDRELAARRSCTGLGLGLDLGRADGGRGRSTAGQQHRAGQQAELHKVGLGLHGGRA